MRVPEDCGEGRQLRTVDSHQLLGVSRYASREAVKRAFRLRLLEVHPDRNPGDSTAAERTRRLIEAYHALTANLEPARAESSLTAAGEGRFVAFRTRRSPMYLPDWARRALGGAVLLGVIAWVALSTIRAVSGSTGPVFQPDPDGLYGISTRTRTVAPIVEPSSIDDCIGWYCAREYQLSAAGDWAAREILRIYREAAKAAQLRGDRTLASFYTSAVRKITESRRAALL